MGITPSDLERMEYMEIKSEELYQMDLIVYEAMFNLKLIIEKDIFDTDEIGVARCHPDDKFNMTVGYKLAYCRAHIFKAENTARKYRMLKKYIMENEINK